MAEPGDLIRVRVRNRLRMLARVVSAAPTGGTIEVVGSGERVVVTGLAWRSAVVLERAQAAA